MFTKCCNVSYMLIQTLSSNNNKHNKNINNNSISNYDLLDFLKELERKHVSNLILNKFHDQANLADEMN